MLLAAYASLYHWLKVGESPVNAQRGYWILSRVYQSLNQAAPALAWALKCLETSEDSPSEMKDFDRAYAHEALARSYALGGDLVQAKKYYQMALKLGNSIQDPEDQQIFMNDLSGGDWGAFSVK